MKHVLLHFSKGHVKTFIVTLLLGLFLPVLSLQAVVKTYTKVTGTPIITTITGDAPAVGDTMLIKGAALETGDWDDMRNYDNHIMLETPNTSIPAFSSPAQFRSFSSSYITTIEQSAFKKAPNLASVNLPNVTTLSDSAFKDCPVLVSANFPLLGTIGKFAFYNCDNLVSINFPKVTTVLDTAFAKSDALISVVMRNVTDLRDGAFSFCSNLASVSFPKITKVNRETFCICRNLASFNMPLVTEVGSGSFAGTKIADINAVMPELTTVGHQAFQQCDELVDLYLPNVTQVGIGAFSICANLEKAEFPALEEINVLLFDQCPILKTLIFPKLTSLGIGTVQDCLLLEFIAMPKLEKMDFQPFADCPSLQCLQLNENPPIITNSLGLPITPPCYIHLDSWLLASMNVPMLIIVPDSTKYPASVLMNPYGQFPPGTEAFNARVATESFLITPGTPITLTPKRIPTVTGGYYKWEKDGIAIPGANSTTYSPTKEGVYTLKYVFAGQEIVLMSAEVAFDAYNFQGTFSRYEGCTNKHTLSFPTDTIERNVHVWVNGTGADYIYAPDSNKFFKDTLVFKLNPTDSVISFRYTLDESLKDNTQFKFEFQIPGGVLQESEIFTLYEKPEISLVKFYPATTQFEGRLEIDITKGSPYIQRSFDGGQSWTYARDTLTGEMLPFTQSQIGYLKYGDYILFRQPNRCSGFESLLIDSSEGPGNAIYRKVMMPTVSDAICSALPGQHFITSGSDFVFTLTPTGNSIGKVPNVTTSRTIVPDSEGVTVKLNADGSYTISILGIHEPTTISIDFVLDKEDIAETDVWTNQNRLYIRSAKAGYASIHTIAGVAVQTIQTEAGETSDLSLPSGLYIVTLHGKTYKVVIN